MTRVEVWEVDLGPDHTGRVTAEIDVGDRFAVRILDDDGETVVARDDEGQWRAVHVEVTG